MNELMSRDVSHIAGWVLAMLAIIAFAIVLRDLLIMRAERIAREREFERLRVAAHEAEHERAAVRSMLD